MRFQEAQAPEVTVLIVRDRIFGQSRHFCHTDSIGLHTVKALQYLRFLLQLWQA